MTRYKSGLTLGVRNNDDTFSKDIHGAKKTKDRIYKKCERVPCCQ